MSQPSIEALAMAGADYAHCGIVFVELDDDGRAPPPPHLRLPQQQSKQPVAALPPPFDGSRPYEQEKMKERLVSWAKAVATLVAAQEHEPSA